MRNGFRGSWKLLGLSLPAEWNSVESAPAYAPDQRCRFACRQPLETGFPSWWNRTARKPKEAKGKDSLRPGDARRMATPTVTHFVGHVSSHWACALTISPWSCPFPPSPDKGKPTVVRHRTAMVAKVARVSSGTGGYGAKVAMVRRQRRRRLGQWRQEMGEGNRATAFVQQQTDAPKTCDKLVQVWWAKAVALRVCWWSPSLASHHLE